MRTRISWVGWGAVALVLTGATSCAVPERRPVAKAPERITDARELVRRLVPDVRDTAVAGLPEQVGATPLTSAQAAPFATLAMAQPFLATAASDADAMRARDCLTAAVYYEARSEPVEGQRAVAQVVLNRVRDRAFPHSVCGVVYQGVGGGRGCQFSFACDGSTLRPREPDAWDRAARVAVAALNGGVMADVGNATFYHANYVLPWWARSMTRLGSVGSHIFYRWPGAVERALGLRAQYAGVEPGAPVARAEGTAVAVRSASVFGVTVHRGVGQDAAVEGAAPAPVVRQAAFSGVRIHRGESGPGTAETALDILSGA